MKVELNSPTTLTTHAGFYLQNFEVVRRSKKEKNAKKQKKDSENFIYPKGQFSFSNYLDHTYKYNYSIQYVSDNK